MRPAVLLLPIGLAVAAVACARGQSDYEGKPGVPWVDGDGGGAGSSGSNGFSGGNSGSSGNSGQSSGSSGSGGASGSGGSSGSSGSSGASGNVDAGSKDSGGGGNKDAGPPPVDSGNGGLDPLLSLPDPSGVPCVPGLASEIGCPALSVCRLSSPSGGRCESCTDCGNLGNSCSSGKDCDILFECYAGKCVNFCLLGSYNCGPIENCVNVGHPTLGVCKP